MPKLEELSFIKALYAALREHFAESRVRLLILVASGSKSLASAFLVWFMLCLSILPGMITLVNKHLSNGFESRKQQPAVSRILGVYHPGNQLVKTTGSCA